ncbi:MAG: ABC transporter permease, partial [Actinobacteria bacterium]|nr:ABC transporter permease [Actinomycetota bacterium]
MTGYLVRRILALVPIWLGISLFAFTLASLSPGDPARLILEGRQNEPVTPEQIEAFRERFGLNDPFVVQYVRWVGRATQGDLGDSFRSGQPVLAELASRFPATLQLAVPGFAVAVLLAVGVGVLSAVRRGSLSDHGSRLAALLADSIPSFVLAYLLIIVLS